MPTQNNATSRTQAAYERIRADIVAGYLLPGSRLKIDSLTEALGVSLGAVREALSRLTSDGLVVAQPQRGFVVSPISAADLEDLTMVRCEIEALCLRRAIKLGDVAWEAQLVAALHHLLGTPSTDTSDPKHYREDWAVLHDKFHETMVSACESPWLLRLREQLYVRSERYRRLSLPLAEYDRDVDAEHNAIAEAVLARDAEAAVNRTAEHLQTTTRILLTSDALARATLETTGE